MKQPHAKKRVMVRAICASVIVCANQLAFALPAVGEVVLPASVSDTHGAARRLPDARYPVIVIYEDENAEKENERADKFVDQTTSLSANDGKIEAVAVADLQKWNWLPAKNFALAQVRKVEAKLKSPIYTDFPGELRKRWGLAKKKSSVLVLSPEGRVLYAAEGPVTEAQIQSFGEALKKFGVTLPTR